MSDAKRLQGSSVRGERMKMLLKCCTGTLNFANLIGVPQVKGRRGEMSVRVCQLCSAFSIKRGQGMKMLLKSPIWGVQLWLDCVGMLLKAQEGEERYLLCQVLMNERGQRVKMLLKSYTGTLNFA